MKPIHRKHRIMFIAGAAIAALAAPVMASHSWSNYHWARTANTPLAVPVHDNVDASWQSYYVGAVNDWNVSAYIESPMATGSANPKTCKAVAGTIQVCNARYGRTGWLGIASIWLSGGHISQGTTKLNDTYFLTATYNTPSWRALVACQEIGHDYGLGHQDENFSTDSTNSCMDYTSNPQGNEHPDAHDYAQLESIYGYHTDSAVSAGGRGNSGLGAESGDTPAEWGRAIHYTHDGRPDVFERAVGSGQKMITHVFWALGEGPRGNHVD